MSRGRERRKRRHHTIAAARQLPHTTGESAKSRAYTEGRTFGYTGRIRGPQFPVKTYTIDNLPGDSQLN